MALLTFVSAPRATEIENEPARDLFGAVAKPSSGAPRPIGFFSKGCLAGAVPLPLDGEDWQVMRLSRNRFWGMPVLVRTIEHIARDARKFGWPGLLIGDMSQPRGGPMKTGHASHQIGLDADIWLTPMPPYTLSRDEREEKSAVNVVAPDRLTVDHSVWTPAHLGLIKAAAEQPEVTRIFVNAAIKKELCRTAGSDRGWMTKVRPYWGHDDHIHIRLACPGGASACEEQDAPPEGDGCAEKDLAYWFQPEVLHPTPGKPRPPLPLSALPEACRAVLLEK
ncbi:MAG: penicillin-insensitive murein endopeptidase [Hyphomicrobiales bacterium]|nr:penicillin-insensitive murein endopeptidase [Hyphomicrobiales bacterium]MBV8427845.1 penicillin-insensitive murein endopeptidase [Hyphomicrobiales bacterium]